MVDVYFTGFDNNKLCLILLPEIPGNLQGANCNRYSDVAPENTPGADNQALEHKLQDLN